MTDIQFYGVGFCYLSVCAPSDASTDAIETAANLEHPTGIKSRWRVAKDPTFATSECNPCVCNTDPARKHWLLAC